MEELVFSTFVIEIKKSFEKASDMDLIQLLFDCICDPAIESKIIDDSYYVSKKRASLIINRQKGGCIPSNILNLTTKPCVKESVSKFFEKDVVPRIIPAAVDDLLQRLQCIIGEDCFISDSKREELLNMAKEETLAVFLANVFLYSLTRDNVRRTDAEDSPIKSNEIVKNTDEKLKQTPLEKIPYSDVPAQEEHIYIDAILQVYGQLEGKNRLTLEEIETIPEYIDEFKDQRSYFYAAEAVRRGTRDVYDDADTQFTYLKDEIYEGTKEVWRQQCKNGQTRMRNVLTQACNTSLSGCLLNRETHWIGALQRKGMCHILVNEERIKGWVRDDDDDSVQQ